MPDGSHRETLRVVHAGLAHPTTGSSSTPAGLQMAATNCSHKQGTTQTRLNPTSDADKGYHSCPERHSYTNAPHLRPRHAHRQAAR